MQKPQNNLDDILRRQPLHPTHVLQSTSSVRLAKCFSSRSNLSLQALHRKTAVLARCKLNTVVRASYISLFRRQQESLTIARKAATHISTAGTSAMNLDADFVCQSHKRVSPDPPLKDSKSKKIRLTEEKENLPQPYSAPSHPLAYSEFSHPEVYSGLIDTGQGIVGDGRVKRDSIYSLALPRKKYDDLNGKNISHLQKLLSANIEYHTHATDNLTKFYSGQKLDVDVFVIQEKILDERITYIRSLIQDKEKEVLDLTDIEAFSDDEILISGREESESFMTALSGDFVELSDSALICPSVQAQSSARIAADGFSDIQILQEIDVNHADMKFDKIQSMTATTCSTTVTTSNARTRTIDDVEVSSESIRRIDQTATAYYTEALKKLKTVFKLDSFRKNQLEAINATMAGQDVFVLMPTGGGKSLCFQVPAVCQSGRTRGVTVVVSPLIALMIDQVRHLKDKGIDAVLFNSDQDTESSRMTRSRLISSGQKPCLVYVTPEKLLHSSDFNNILGGLYRTKALARFVIDEAHCVSTWGRDFREAYQNLDRLRVDYPDIPIMALTATANVQVINDVIGRLRIPDCIFLTQSFNRPNLYYEIRPKNKIILSDIHSFIKAKYSNDTGIIYCLSRNKCEEVAKELRDKYGLSAKHYHAQMSVQDKTRAQEAWQNGECKIVVATIAFGMGIDKPDVRFVIHYSLPMSLDGYYQETGRAGRDGLSAHCILYYAYSDTNGNFKLIDDNDKLSLEEKQYQRERVQDVVQYCKNKVDCRRVQVLRHFGQTFDPVKCHKSCDNCLEMSETVEEDITDAAKSIFMLAESLLANGRERITKNYCLAVFRGNKIKDIRTRGHDQEPLYGAGADLDKEKVERIFDHLLSLEALGLESIQNTKGWNALYIRLGKKAGKIFEENRRLNMRFKVEIGKPSAAGNKAVRKSRQKSPKITDHKSAENDLIQHSPTSLNNEQFAVIEIKFQDNVQRRASNANKKHVQRTNSMVSASCVRADSPESIAAYHHQQLCKLRSMIARKHNIDDPERLLDTRTIGRLSEILPTDIVSFKAVLQEMLIDEYAVEEKWTLLGKDFLDFCINSSLGWSKPLTSISDYAHRESDEREGTGKSYKFKRQ